MAKRTRTTRTPEASETTLWFLGDRRLYPKPAAIDEWEALALRCLVEKRRKAWEACREMVLEDWERKFPKTRPSASKEFDR